MCSKAKEQQDHNKHNRSFVWLVQLAQQKPQHALDGLQAAAHPRNITDISTQ
jgi:hypothetical protein